MSDDPWDLENAEQTLRDIAAICPFVMGHVIVAAVELATQQVTGARVAVVGEPPDGRDASELVRGLAEQLVPERWASGRDGHGITHVLVTVVCRQGRVIGTECESAWLMAWRRSNPLRGAFNGDVYVVTPHGWGDYLDHRAGYEPCLDAV